MSEFALLHLKEAKIFALRSQTSLQYFNLLSCIEKIEKHSSQDIMPQLKIFFYYKIINLI